jgi:hypothetical protein
MTLALNWWLIALPIFGLGRIFQICAKPGGGRLGQRQPHQCNHKAIHSQLNYAEPSPDARVSKGGLAENDIRWWVGSVGDTMQRGQLQLDAYITPAVPNLLDRVPEAVDVELKRVWQFQIRGNHQAGTAE